MRELHVVAVSEDGRHVILAGKRGAGQGGYRVALDDRLAAAVRGDLPQPGSDAPTPSDLSPKQIQSRLRSGESAQSIALAAGVPVARVERFSGPVQGEMARIIDAARSSYLVRGRLGPSAIPLGAAVDAALAQLPSLRPESTDWETRREESGSWLVTVTWFARKRSREASWRYDPAAKQLSAADPASAVLGHAAAAPVRKAAARKAPAKKAPAKKAAVKKAAVKKAAVRKPPVKRAPAARAKKAAPARKAVLKAPVRQAAPVKRAVAKAPARKAPVTAKARLRVVPDPTSTPTRAKGKTAAERDGVKTRATVPGWADVLLGTTPGGDR